MGVGSVGQGQGGTVGPLEFYTWYWWSRRRLNGAMFRSCFFRCPRPPSLEIFLPMSLCSTTLVAFCWQKILNFVAQFSCVICGKWEVTIKRGFYKQAKEIKDHWTYNITTSLNMENANLL